MSDVLGGMARSGLYFVAAVFGYFMLAMSCVGFLAFAWNWLHEDDRSQKILAVDVPVTPTLLVSWIVMALGAVLLIGLARRRISFQSSERFTPSMQAFFLIVIFGLAGASLINQALLWQENSLQSIAWLEREMTLDQSALLSSHIEYLRSSISRPFFFDFGFFGFCAGLSFAIVGKRAADSFRSKRSQPTQPNQGDD